jgi:hypothetical protein
MGVATAPSCTGAAHGSKLSLKRSGPHTQHVWEVGVTLSKTPRLQDLDVLPCCCLTVAWLLPPYFF